MEQFTSTSEVPLSTLKVGIQNVKDHISDGLPVLKLIEKLLDEHPHSSYLLALKASVYASMKREETLQIINDATGHIDYDDSAVLEVLSILRSSCISAGLLRDAITLYKDACKRFPDNLDLKMELFDCYARSSLYEEQLEISLEMYTLKREDKFLLWAVFSIQLQVFCHLLKKHMVTHHLNESEEVLAYISVTEKQAGSKHALEVLSKLGLTLLVVEVDKLHIKRGRLLAHICDYTAAVVALKEKSESLGGRKSLLESLRCLDDDTYLDPPVVFACKLVQLSEDQFGRQVLDMLQVADLNTGRRRCCPGDLYDDEVELSLYEYFNRVGYKAEVFLQVVSKDEEHHLIGKLQGISKSDLKDVFIPLLAQNPINHSGLIPATMTKNRGTMICVKLNGFIILASDGKVVNGLNFNNAKDCEKVRQFDDICVAFTGNWSDLEEFVAPVRKYMEGLKNSGKERPPVYEFIKVVEKEVRLVHEGDFGILVCSFDDTQDGPSPCVWFANEIKHFQIVNSSFCNGSGSFYSGSILKSVREDMGLAEAIDVVEKALVAASRRDGCTSGIATITVMFPDGGVKVVAREDLHTTLWSRHQVFLKSHDDIFVDLFERRPTG